VQEFVFIQITNVERFRQDLVKLAPLVATTRQVQAQQDAINNAKGSADLIPIVGLTVGFSNFALKKVSNTDYLILISPSP
jgi:hypothetical protein